MDTIHFILSGTILAVVFGILAFCARFIGDILGSGMQGKDNGKRKREKQQKRRMVKIVKPVEDSVLAKEVIDERKALIEENERLSQLQRKMKRGGRWT